MCPYPPALRSLICREQRFSPGSSTPTSTWRSERSATATGNTPVSPRCRASSRCWALRNAINAGWIPGPRIVAAGISFGIRGGHCDETNGLQPEALDHEGGIEVGVADGIEEVRNAVRYMVKYGADVIKICATGGVLSLTDSVGVQQSTEDEIGAIVETATQPARP